jgi:hypothetical protein
MDGLSITQNFDEGLIFIKNEIINVKIPIEDFAILTALFLQNESTMMELCLCYQEQF